MTPDAAGPLPRQSTQGTDRTRAELVRRLGHLLGLSDLSVQTLAGDASTRRYHRVTGGGRSRVVMELPEDDRGRYTPDAFPFLNVQRFLANADFPVPAVYQVDLQAGLIALEDLGDRTFEQAVREADAAGRRGLYQRALELIVTFQKLGREPAQDCLAFGRGFDFSLLRWELDHFQEWFLEAERGVVLTAAEQAVLTSAFDQLAQGLANSPQVLVHRDFQSRNLMVTPGRPDTGVDVELRVIDFQDALMGCAAYDLVALLRDSYVELPPDEVDDLVNLFAQRAGHQDPVAFRRLFDRQALQRKLKDTGRFVFIDRVRGNPSFLRWIPTSLRYVRDSLRRVDEFAAAREVLERHVPELR